MLLRRLSIALLLLAIFAAVFWILSAIVLPRDLSGIISLPTSTPYSPPTAEPSPIPPPTPSAPTAIPTETPIPPIEAQIETESDSAAAPAENTPVPSADP